MKSFFVCLQKFSGWFYIHYSIILVIQSLHNLPRHIRKIMIFLMVLSFFLLFCINIVWINHLMPTWELTKSFPQLLASFNAWHLYFFVAQVKEPHDLTPLNGSISIHLHFICIVLSTIHMVLKQLHRHEQETKVARKNALL